MAISAWLAKLSLAPAAIFAIVWLACSSSAQAIEGQQMAFRTGGIYSAYAGPTSNSFMIPTSLELEYEFLYQPRRSFGLSSMFAYDFGGSIMRYLSAGLFFRNYPWTNAIASDENRGGYAMKTIPTSRFYWGTEAKVAQIVVKNLSPVLVSVSQVVELGGHVGMVFPVERLLSFSVQTGACVGIGFSSVSVTTYDLRLTFGLTYLFSNLKGI